MLLADKRPFLGQVRLAGSIPARPRPLLGGAATAVTDGTLSQALSAPMAVVDFWSDTCPYCMVYKPIFEDVATVVDPKVVMATIHVDDNMKSAEQFKIQGLPTTIFFKDGKEVNRVEGKMEKGDLQSHIARIFSVNAGPIAPPSSGGAAAASPGGAPSSTAGILSGLALAGILGGVVYFITTKA